MDTVTPRANTVSAMPDRPTTHVCAEIAYPCGVHSDLCHEIPTGDLFGPDARAMFHEALDEFLDHYRAGHGGGFGIGTDYWTERD